MLLFMICLLTEPRTLDLFREVEFNQLNITQKAFLGTIKKYPNYLDTASIVEFKRKEFFASMKDDQPTNYQIIIGKEIYPLNVLKIKDRVYLRSKDKNKRVLITINGNIDGYLWEKEYYSIEPLGDDIYVIIKISAF